MTDRKISLNAAIAAVHGVPPGALFCGQAIVEALSSLPSVDGWLDIESAPVGDRIIAAVKVQNNKTGEEWWDMHTVIIDDETGEIEADNDAGWAATDYSHWQPLPDPPAEK